MTLNAMKKDKNIPTLNQVMKKCCCYTCGAGSVRTYEKERLGLDAKTLKPNYEYRRYEWHTIDDPEESEHYENVAWTKKDDCWGQSLVVNNGDSEPSTKEKYELNK